MESANIHTMRIMITITSTSHCQSKSLYNETLSPSDHYNKLSTTIQVSCKSERCGTASVVSVVAGLYLGILTSGWGAGYAGTDLLNVSRHSISVIYATKKLQMYIMLRLLKNNSAGMASMAVIYPPD